MYLGERLGNIYTGSLYSGLISLICNDSIDLIVNINFINKFYNLKKKKNKKIMMFSYGSGLASSLFIVRVIKNLNYIPPRINLIPRLESRIKISLSEFDKVMNDRE